MAGPSRRGPVMTSRSHDHDVMEGPSRIASLEPEPAACTAEERAHVGGGSRPYVVAVDDIMFQRPVEIGSLLFLSSQVCYTENNYVQIRVHSEVSDPITREHHTTNIFHFTYMSEKEMPQIVPQTYGQSMLYLDGKRHFDAVVRSRNGQSQSS
ncbi:unnamed protein product [Ranitomeya imitator]|uniref:HotDog ACOT-type domain-containing protein n=1 Tax=Ranitomeya imitator TaxID=111125 RepID=A0ABN9KZ86_9NEOB|nr:unnamed protein product [Ranitomeya imitator]